MIIIFKFEISNVIPFQLEEKINKLENYNIIGSEQIRERINKPTTEIDRKINYFVNNGLLMPDSFLIESLLQNWKKDHINIFVNFPKNEKQLNTLNYYLEKLEDKIEKIFFYSISDNEKVYNIAKNNYGKVYDKTNKNPTFEAIKNHSKSSREVIRLLKNVEIIERDFFDKEEIK